jgi:hypothetical protein
MAETRQPTAETDFFRLGGGGYLLDQIPSLAMAKVMQRIWGGDRVVLPRAGKGYVWEHSDDPVPAVTVKALLARQWIVEPSFPLPLFGDQHSGRLTVRGQKALNRFNFG